MMSRAHKIIIVALLTLGFAPGCKSLKETATPEALKSYDFEELIEKVHQNHADFKTFSARISAQASFAHDDYTFNGALRIVKDSAIYISATLSIIGEVARVVITPDSLRFLNRLEGTYYSGEFDFLNRLLGARVDYKMLQALLIGNDLTHFSYQKPEVSTEKDKFVAALNHRTPVTNPTEWPIQNKMWISTTTHRIIQNMFLDLSANRMVRAIYKAHGSVEGQLIPVDMELLFSEPANSVLVSLQLSRIMLNLPVEITFSVPSRYRAIE